MLGDMVVPMCHLYDCHSRHEIDVGDACLFINILHSENLLGILLITEDGLLDIPYALLGANAGRIANDGVLLRIIA